MNEVTVVEFSKRQKAFVESCLSVFKRRGKVALCDHILDANIEYWKITSEVLTLVKFRVNLIQSQWEELPCDFFRLDDLLENLDRKDLLSLH